MRARVSQRLPEWARERTRESQREPERARESQREPENEPERKPQRATKILSGSLWLSLAPSGLLRLFLALRICLQSRCLAHKALARLVAGLLRYSTFFIPGVLEQSSKDYEESGQYLSVRKFWVFSILHIQSSYLFLDSYTLQQPTRG